MTDALILNLIALLVEFSSDGASRPQTPRCFLVLDYLCSSTRKLQFYVELANAEICKSMQINLQMPFDFCTFAMEFPQVD